jgi:hypothetical protein
MKKRYVLLIIIIIIFIFSFGIPYYYFTIQPKGILQISKNCPEEFNKTSITLTSRSFSEIYPTTIYEKGYVGDKGRFNGYCRLGSEEGENVNWIYCDTHGTSLIYERNRTIDNNGIIHNGEKWNVKIIVNKNKCDNYIKSDFTRGVLPFYRCDIIKIKCW